MRKLEIKYYISTLEYIRDPLYLYKHNDYTIRLREGIVYLPIMLGKAKVAFR